MHRTFITDGCFQRDFSLGPHVQGQIDIGGKHHRPYDNRLEKDGGQGDGLFKKLGLGQRGQFQVGRQGNVSIHRQIGIFDAEAVIVHHVTHHHVDAHLGRNLNAIHLDSPFRQLQLQDFHTLGLAFGGGAPFGTFDIIAVGIHHPFHIADNGKISLVYLQGLERFRHFGILIAHHITGSRILNVSDLGQKAVRQRFGGRIEDEDLTHLRLLRRCGQDKKAALRIYLIHLPGHFGRYHHGLRFQFILDACIRHHGNTGICQRLLRIVITAAVHTTLFFTGKDSKGQAHQNQEFGKSHHVSLLIETKISQSPARALPSHIKTTSKSVADLEVHFGRRMEMPLA